MITVISGTNRTGSVSAQVAAFVAETYADLGAEIGILDLAELRDHALATEWQLGSSTLATSLSVVC